MKASLPMYYRPETADATHRFWALIRDQLRANGINAPQRLEHGDDPMLEWKDPALLLSQTCGMPYRTRLFEQVQLVGTPDIGREGCQPGYYLSVLVASRADRRKLFEDFANAQLAYNDRLSQSGWAAPLCKAETEGFSFGSFTKTGSHLESARAVAIGYADIAAIDIFAWQLIRRFEVWSSNLKVVGHTSPTPGLPLITAQGKLVEALFHAIEEAAAALASEDRDLLPFKAIIYIPKSEYLSIPCPPEPAPKTRARFDH